MKIKQWDKTIKIWDIIRTHKLYRSSIKKFRKDMGVPFDGFPDRNTYYNWYKEVNLNTESKLNYFEKISHFYDDIDSKFGFFNIRSYNLYIFETLFFENILMGEKISSECTLFLGKKDDNYNKGIYL